MNAKPELIVWLRQYFQDPRPTIATTDASHRQYFRLKNKQGSYVVMDASLEKASLAKFLTIHQLLKKHKIYVPHIHQQAPELGYLLLEDLGGTTFLDKQNPTNLNLYKQALDDLIHLQSFDIQLANLPAYNALLWQQELQLFPSWYLRKYHQYQPNYNEIIRLSTIFTTLIAQISTQKKTLVHRDYHSRNIMYTPAKKLAYIDFQDTLIGPYSYDVCSLLKDAYYALAPAELKTLLQYYYKHSKPSTSYDDFITHFDIMSIQRQLKVLGIFARLAMRDNKHQYLENIPMVEHYLLQTLKNYPQFSVLSELIKR